MLESSLRYNKDQAGGRSYIFEVFLEGGIKHWKQESWLISAQGEKDPICSYRTFFGKSFELHSTCLCHVFKQNKCLYIAKEESLNPVAVSSEPEAAGRALERGRGEDDGSGAQASRSPETPCRSSSRRRGSAQRRRRRRSGWLLPAGRSCTAPRAKCRACRRRRSPCGPW